MPRAPNLVDTSPRALVINRRHDPIVEPLPAYGHVERRRLIPAVIDRANKEERARKIRVARILITAEVGDRLSPTSRAALAEAIVDGIESTGQR